MSTAILSNGTSYYIPQADLSFFTALAERMKWQIVGKGKKADKTTKISQAMALMDTMMAKGGTPVPYYISPKVKALETGFRCPESLSTDYKEEMSAALAEKYL